MALQDVDMNVTGVYGCEVTMDYPYYTTAAKTGKLNVVGKYFISASVSKLVILVEKLKLILLG